MMTSYVEQSLGEHETIIRCAAIPWPYHLASWLSLIFLGVILVGVFIFVRMSIWIASTEFALTDRRIVHKTGWIRRQTQELSLNAIEEIEVKQGFWGRIFGMGRLVLSGAGMGEIHSPPVADPIGLRAALSDARAALYAAAANPAESPA